MVIHPFKLFSPESLNLYLRGCRDVSTCQQGPLVYPDTAPPAMCQSTFYTLFFIVFVQPIVQTSTCSWLWLLLTLILEVVGTLKISKVILRKEETCTKISSTNDLNLLKVSFYSKCPRICGKLISW